MIFSSMVFLCIFLPVTFLLHSILPSVKARNVMLIVASLVFYAYGEPVYIILMLASTVINYIFGLIIGYGRNNEKNKLSRAVLVLAVVTDLALLGIFKYADMFCGLVSDIPGINIQKPGLALPIGISFYTFQVMSYIIDVYRGEVSAQRNYLNLLLYISFFPQLIAGPIVKYHDIESQIYHRSTDTESIAEGLRRFILGLSKKVLIANVMAVAADGIFALDIGDINIFGAWIGAVAYMLQIYYDFSGYSDMAIGMGRMFGFRFNENFNYPYASASIKEFWRRWHISLSTWFREYLYIPMGGNRRGRVRAWFNRMFVFFCTGLWHGANWTFVLWGIYHGLLLFAEDVISGINTPHRLPVFVRRLLTLLAVCVGFVMFRADTAVYGFGFIARMFTGFGSGTVQMGYAVRQLTPLFIVTAVAGISGQLPWLPALKKKVGTSKVADAAGYAAAVLLLMLCILKLSGGSYNPFIYLRF